MAGSIYFTISAGVRARLVPFQLAKAEDILGLAEDVETGFELLPDPEISGLPGFNEVFTILEPVLPAHPASKNYVDTGMSSQVAQAAASAAAAGVSAAAALASEVAAATSVVTSLEQMFFLANQ